MFGNCTNARTRLRNRLGRAMVVYVLLVFCSTWMLKHQHMNEWGTYFFAVLPAAPMIAFIAAMGRYLHDETDEFQRLLFMRSVLVGTAALLGLLVISDLLRSATSTGALPPFAGFVVFCLAFAVAQLVQTLQNRPAEHEE
jgi:peptidoglycan/LPS O-acetylase OafA/YrhL